MFSPIGSVSSSACFFIACNAGRPIWFSHMNIYRRSLWGVVANSFITDNIVCLLNEQVIIVQKILNHCSVQPGMQHMKLTYKHGDIWVCFRVVFDYVHVFVYHRSYCLASPTAPTVPIPCPGGTYGSVSGLQTALCSGQCTAGVIYKHSTEIQHLTIWGLPN